MIILLTGATGFLGSNLLKKFIENNYNVVVLKRSFSNIERINCLNSSLIKCYDIEQTNFEYIFKENKIDLIVHCATNYGRNKESIKEIISSNVFYPLELLQLGKKYNVKSFINTDTILGENISDYSLSKKQFRDWLQKFSDSMMCVNIVMDQFYGLNNDNTKFISRIINDLMKKVEKIDLTLGIQKRNFIYIDDLINAYMYIIDFILKNNKNGFYNFEVGGEETIEIKKFCELVKKITFNNITILNYGVIPYRKNESMETKIDMTKINSLGWFPQISLENGIKKIKEKIKNGSNC